MTAAPSPVLPLPHPQLLVRKVLPVDEGLPLGLSPFSSLLPTHSSYF